jgi:hypothetical protein
MARLLPPRLPTTAHNSSTRSTGSAHSAEFLLADHDALAELRVSEAMSMTDADLSIKALKELHFFVPDVGPVSLFKPVVFWRMSGGIRGSR